MTTVEATHPAARDQRATRGRLALEGARDIVPMVIGVLPLGFAIGSAIANSSVPPLAGWLGGPLIFGGAAHLIAVQLLDAGAAPAVIVVSALLVNARVVMYGAAIAPWFRGATRRQRLLVAAPLIDPLFFISTARYERGDLDQGERLAYYAGAASLLLVAWMTVQAIAIRIGGSLPDGIGIQVAAPLVFAGMLAKSTVGRPAALAAGAAALTAMIGTGLPYQSGMTLAVVVGIAAGWSTEQSSRHHRQVETVR
jgi:predicted branched-subunit amino acid permease